MIRFLTMTVLLVFLATSAWANCEPKNIAGFYVAYFTDVDSRTTNVCLLDISARGRVARNFPCLIQHIVKGGRLAVGKECVVTGTIKTNGRNIKIFFASMDKGKSFVAGAFSSGGRRGTFTAVKHPESLGASPALARSFGD